MEIAETMETERRIAPSSRWRLDKNINISAVIAGIVILWSVIHYGSSILEQQSDTNKKVNIMWQYFVKDKPELQRLFE